MIGSLTTATLTITGVRVLVKMRREREMRCLRRFHICLNAGDKGKGLMVFDFLSIVYELFECVPLFESIVFVCKPIATKSHEPIEKLEEDIFTTLLLGH